MNQFNNLIHKERQKQNKVYYFFSIIIILFVFISFFYFIYINGVKIIIDVDEADKSAEINLLSGNGVIFQNKLLSFSTINDIEIIKNGYKLKNIQVNIKNSKSNLIVKLDKLPGLLTVTTNTLSKKTKWFLNSNLIAEDSIIKIKLLPGIHNLEVDNRYYIAKSIDLDIKKGEDRTLKVDLEPIQGFISINTNPLGANIFINNIDNGKSPAKFDLAGGEYIIRIEKEGYLNINEKIIIDNKKNSSIRSYNLLPKLIDVKFDLSPSGGILLVNGNNIDNKDSDLKVSLNPFETYSINYSKLGYVSETKSVNFKNHNVKNIIFDLKDNMGLVNISSNPIADIYINKKLLGKTPLTIELKSILQEIKIIKEGYAIFIKNIIPSEKLVTKVDINLITLLNAELDKKGDEFANSIGITMKLFKPNNFIMGAYRQEKGQRANEFIRNVYLRKYFYASLFEITNKDFSEFMLRPFDDAKKNYPVVNITWLDAIKFCNWLSLKENLNPVYNIKDNKNISFNLNNDGYRLPTEAEWEWLARKSNRKKQQKFVWGNQLKIPKSGGNLADESAIGIVDIYIPGYNDGYPSLAPVGSFKKEDSGLYDLSGNVSEWINDFYLLYPPNADILYYDPSGPKEGSSHVVKGSNFRSGSLTEIRASYRDSEVNTQDYIGFRIVRYVYGKQYENNIE